MPTRLGKRFAILTLLALCAGVVLASAAQAAELVMFRRDGCSWCAKWDREIGPIFHGPVSLDNPRETARQSNVRLRATWLNNCSANRDR